MPPKKKAQTPTRPRSLAQPPSTPAAQTPNASTGPSTQVPAPTPRERRQADREAAKARQEVDEVAVQPGPARAANVPVAPSRHRSVSSTTPRRGRAPTAPPIHNAGPTPAGLPTVVEDDEEENEENQIDNRHIKPEVINEEVESADGESHVKNDDFLRDGLQKEYDDLLAEYRASVQVLDDSRVENDDHLTDDPQNEFDDMWVDVVRAGTAAHRPNHGDSHLGSTTFTPATIAAQRPYRYPNGVVFIPNGRSYREKKYYPPPRNNPPPVVVQAANVGKSWWQYFCEETESGRRHFRHKSWRWFFIVPLEVLFLATIPCSAGPICETHSWYSIIRKLLSDSLYNSANLTCCAFVHVLLMSESVDFLLGFPRAYSAMRQENRLREYFHPADGWGILWIAYTRFFPDCIKALCDHCLEPMMIPALALTLTWLPWWQNDGCAAFVWMAIVHVVKWAVQATERYFHEQHRRFNTKGPWKRWMWVSVCLLLIVFAAYKSKFAIPAEAHEFGSGDGIKYRAPEPTVVKHAVFNVTRITSVTGDVMTVISQMLSASGLAPPAVMTLQ